MKIFLAGCVILDDYGRILLLHRNTPRVTHWELPGSKIEVDETAEQAAIREIAEELGVDVRLIRTLGVAEFEEGDKEFHFTWFQAVVIEADPRLRETELFDDLDYFNTEDLMSLALSTNMLVLLDKLLLGELILKTD